MAISKMVRGTSTAGDLFDSLNASIDLIESKTIGNQKLRNDIDGLVIGSGTDLNVENYGLTPDDELFDNSQPFIDLCALAENGDNIVFGKSKVYHFLSYSFIDLSNKSLNINLNGSTLVVHNANTKGFEFHGGWSSNQAFTSLGGTDDMVVSGIPDTSLIRPREMIRLTSDDLATDTRGDSAFQAEDIFVEEIIDANSILLGNKSISKIGPNTDYLTNPRISQISGNTLNIYNGVIKHKDGLTGLAQLNAPLLRLVALYNPIVKNIRTTRGYRWCVETVACLFARVNDCEFTNLDNTDKAGDQNVFGSGLIDCSFGTRVNNVTGIRVRHLVDTHCQNYGSFPSKPEQYGSSTDLNVYGCMSVSSTGDSFGAHHQSRGVVYNTCISLYSEKFGFQARGDVELINCKSMYCDKDINIFDEDNLNPSRTKAVIRNHRNIRSGVATNSNRGVPVDFYNYRGEDVTTVAGTGFYSSGMEEAVTNFRGYTYVSFSEPRDQYNSHMGNNIKGAINFDTLELIFPDYVSGKIYDGIDIRGDGTANNFTLKGDLLKVDASGTRFLLTGAMASPIRDDQIVFDMIVKGWGTTKPFSEICKDSRVDLVRNVNLLTERQALQSGRIEQVVADFGASVAVDEIVTAAVPYEALSVDSFYDINAINNTPDILIISCVVTADNVVTITAINKGAAARDMSAINLSLKCVAV